MAVLRNGEESLDTFLIADRDADAVRGGPSHGYIPSCVSKSRKSEQQLQHYEGVRSNVNNPPLLVLRGRGCHIFREKPYVTLEWPLIVLPNLPGFKGFAKLKKFQKSKKKL